MIYYWKLWDFDIFLSRTWKCTLMIVDRAKNPRQIR